MNELLSARDHETTLLKRLESVDCELESVDCETYYSIDGRFENSLDFYISLVMRVVLVWVRWVVLVWVDISRVSRLCFPSRACLDMPLARDSPKGSNQWPKSHIASASSHWISDPIVGGSRFANRDWPMHSDLILWKH